MAAEEKWYFTKEQLATTPSKKFGIDPDKELSYRQQAANFIQDMGQRLKVTQLCINTAIVYMHRFYMFHSFTAFHRNSMSTASLFLAAKVEEQPRKLEHVITVAHWCLKGENKLDTKSELYQENAQELVFNENVLLQTLGFDVGIDHPHTHVVKCCHLVRANKELAQTSYFMASNSLHLTTMCLQYKPTLVACFCIHLACKWSNWEIPQSSEGKDWFYYVDNSVTIDQLEQLTAEFLVIYDKCPSRLKKMNSKRNEESFNLMMSGVHPPLENTGEPRKIRPPSSSSSSSSGRPESSSSQRSGEELKKPHPHHRVDFHQYKEKKQREAAAAAAAAKDGRPVHHHMPRPPMPGNPATASAHQSSLKREQMKREMAARESAKREAMKSMDARRELPQPRLGDTVPLTEHKRVREEVDATQKRAFETGGEMELQAKRPRDEPSMHHQPHQIDPSRSNHMHPSSQMKRPRDNSNSSNGSSEMGYPPISQAKRPREGTDPTMDMLEPSKRPREPMDSTVVKQEPSEFDNIISSSSSSDNKLKFPFQEAAKAPQTKMPASSFSSTTQKHFHQKPAPSRPPSSNELDKYDKQLHPPMAKQEKPYEMQRLPTLGISPFTQRSKSPMEAKQEVKSPEISKKIADALSGQPSSHLFSPEDDREDSALPTDVTFSLEVPAAVSREKSSSPLPKHLQHQLHMPHSKPLSQEQPSSIFTPTKSPVTPTKSHLSSAEKRMRSSSNNSEPALVPMVRKLEDRPGFHSISKSSGTIKLDSDLSPAPSTPGKDTILPLVKQEPDLKSLLAESSMLPTVAAPIKAELVPRIFEPLEEPPLSNEARTEHHHKKKKKEKHAKKDKEKNKDEKKHKHKKKDKDKSKERRAPDETSSPMQVAAPIKITIPKEKFNPDMPSSLGIKIKIPKERLKVEEPIPPPPMTQASSMGGLKIKIGKEVIGERRLPDSMDAKKRGGGGGDNSQASRSRGYKQNGHQDGRKVPLKGESGSLQPSPGCRQ